MLHKSHRRRLSTSRSVRAGRFTDTAAAVIAGTELITSNHRRDSAPMHVEHDREKLVHPFDRPDYESPVIGVRTADDFDPVAFAVVLHDAMVAPKCIHCERPCLVGLPDGEGPRSA